MNKLIWCLVVSSVLFTFVHAVHADPPIVENDIVFGNGGGQDLKRDLARPSEGDGPFPALVLLFGGGLGYYTEDRGQCSGEILHAAQRGYVAVAIDYRLTSIKENGKTKDLFPAQIYDVKAAVRWLRANASKYRIDPSRIGVSGWSSGGHFALLLGLTVPSDGLEGDSGSPL